MFQKILSRFKVKIWYKIKLDLTHELFPAVFWPYHSPPASAIGVSFAVSMAALEPSLNDSFRRKCWGTCASFPQECTWSSLLLSSLLRSEGAFVQSLLSSAEKGCFLSSSTYLFYACLLQYSSLFWLKRFPWMTVSSGQIISLSDFCPLTLFLLKVIFGYEKRGFLRPHSGQRSTQDPLGSFWFLL